jgi:hypothetical protein
MWLNITLQVTVCASTFSDLAARVPGCRSIGPELYYRNYQIFLDVAELERGPLSHLRITEELFELK